MLLGTLKPNVTIDPYKISAIGRGDLARSVVATGICALEKRHEDLVDPANSGQWPHTNSSLTLRPRAAAARFRASRLTPAFRGSRMRLS
jgi:hypothetical protein